MVFFDVGDMGASDELEEAYDMVVVGGGPAGITAGLYAARGGLNVLMIEKAVEGGQMALTKSVENYPGFVTIDGSDLAEKMKAHAVHYGMKSTTGEVTDLRLVSDQIKSIALDDGRSIQAGAVVIATGAHHKRLGVAGEDHFEGKGLSYCSICDGPFFSGREVVVVGGGNSAVDEALYLAQITSKVTIIHRRDQLRAEKLLQDRALSHPKIEFLWDTVVEEFCGEKMLDYLRIRNVKTGASETFPTQGAFIYIGLVPNARLFQHILPLDEEGFIQVDCATLETRIPGVFAAGDVVKKPIRQIVNAASDGALAATMAIKRLNGVI